MTSNPPPPKAGQAQTETPTPQQAKNLLRRFEAYPHPLKIYEQENCFQVSDGSQLWYAFTQKKEHADEIVTALTSHSSLLASHERLKQALEEYITQANKLAAAAARHDSFEYGAFSEYRRACESARAALSLAHSVNNR